MTELEKTMKVNLPNFSQYVMGEDMCCDFEQWANGDKYCILYNGGKTVE